MVWTLEITKVESCLRKVKISQGIDLKTPCRHNDVIFFYSFKSF